MPTERLTSVPARPLTTADCRSIASHPNIETSQPLYHCADDSDAIIMLYLGIDDRIDTLLYNPDDQSWERIDSIDEPDSLADDSGLNTDASQQRFEEYYDADEVEPVDYVEPMRDFAELFPPEPLTDEQLAAIGERSFLTMIVPFVRRQSDTRSIALILVFANPIEARQIIGSYGYDPTENAWALLGTIGRAGLDDEDAVDALSEGTIEWLLDKYPQQEVSLSDDAETALSSQPE